MIKIIGVRFKPVGKVYYFDPGELNVERGSHVIVETARGVEFGEVVFGVRELEDDKVPKPLRQVLRIADENDVARYNENRENEKKAFSVCLNKIEKHKLEMKLIDVEYAFDGSKILFYFTAEGRVDFRDLVKDLANVFRTRIELRQIGVRDEAKMMGSVGMCGKALCCSTFLGEFAPVSIKMAKEQGLSLNPAKISGACGRLMCCLKFEQDAYEDLIKRTPREGSLVKTPDGKGTVESVSLLKQRVKVKIDSETTAELKEYDVSDLKVLKRMRNNDDSEDTSAEEKALKNLED